MSESIGGRQDALTKAVTDNLDGMSHRLHQSMGEATKIDARESEEPA